MVYAAFLIATAMEQALGIGATDFYEVQKRSPMTDPFKMQLSYTKYPADFVACDILYYKDCWKENKRVEGDKSTVRLEVVAIAYIPKSNNMISVVYGVYR